MNAHAIERQFERIGARAKVRADQGGSVREGVSVDVGNDSEGEFFDIAFGRDDVPDLRVIDRHPRIRHLLLLAEQRDGKHKFLCGHDERHWFVAAVPERASASNVQTAFEALKPLAVRRRQDQFKLKSRQRNRRTWRSSTDSELPTRCVVDVRVTSGLSLNRCRPQVASLRRWGRCVHGSPPGSPLVVTHILA